MRLTYKLGNYYRLKDEASSKVGLITDYDGFYAYLVAVNKLGRYEDLAEQGRLVELPCKVGDTVWVITSPFNVYDGNIDYEDCEPEVFEAFVSSVTIYKDNEQYRISAKFTNHFIGVYFRERDFGKTIFLTKSEAEQALAERNGIENIKTT